MAPAEFVAVARVGDLADGAMTVVTVGGEEVLLARVGDEYFAVSAICTHTWGLLDQGTLYGCEVQCPLHTGRFDLRTGKATQLPALKPLPVYTVQVQDATILVGPRLA
jgi:naphthalene 1,2-dioxygenase system ferredoxin subunit